MRRTRVKICGLTDPADAAAAVRAGADAVGVVLADGPRRLTLDAAERVLAEVPPMVARVGVFVDAPEALVAEAVRRLGLTAVQFHGAEPPEACASCVAPVIKAFRVREGFSAHGIDPYRRSAAAVLLDTFVEGVAGGTGRTFPWERFRDSLPEGLPVIVAGGLDPVNVGSAVRALRPYAVDVSSGVEELPGAKDHVKVEAFVAAVRNADSEMRRARA
ncbi:MAG: phosphoribosylanthranilate isomerase [Coriobacteriia bacterium]|nr:phosphoribosylanthranilate isomerase [Coriobacteriia bacterium]